MANRDLLKEAIADAKAVKETAIANAKAALEESFAPMLREKLAAKLAEMDKMEEEEEIKEAEDMKKEEIEETYDTTEEGMDVEEAENVDEEMDLEELLRELEEEEVEEGLGTINDPDTPTAHGNIAEEEEEEGEEEVEGEEEIDLENMEEDDLKKFIEDVIADMVEAGELEGDAEKIGSEDEEETEEEPMMENKEEVNEILGVTAASLGLAKLALPVIAAAATYIGKQYASFKKDQKKAEEFKKRMAAATKPDMSAEEVKAIADKITAELGGKGGDAEKAGVDYKGGAGAATSAIQRESELEEELNEAYNTIKTIKEELDEVNLLNAKLLYTNKIFRASNLSESQKVKVLSAFDKASSVKETELVFETLSTNIKETKTKKPVNESLIKGAASKPAGVAAKKNIVEADSQVLRMQKLAGIIK